MPANAKPEQQRLYEANARRQAWRKWGPYVSERQWGTVREDYSADGDAWNYLPHDHARSRAYRWGEDGIGGFCDDKQNLCVAVALWNGKDPILKERMFGLSNREGNHGEDVKELYYYLDAVPTYSYARMLYKYPQGAFPYDLLVQENARRDRRQPEFEIIDTGIFDADRYFDVDIEYAKAGAEDILLRLIVNNRGPDEAAIHVLPHVWFRNTWSWAADSPKPSLERLGDDVVLTHEKLGVYAIQFDKPDEIKFCENQTNVEKLYGCEKTGHLYKDGLHDYLVKGCESAVDSDKGTKAAGIYRRTIAAGASTTIRVRLSLGPPKPAPFADFEEIFGLRKSEANAFYAELQSKVADEDLRRIQRQAFAGVLWSKQFFCYDVTEWLDGDPAQPKPATARHKGRNSEWVHATMEDVVSMPDKWEFPWFAAWDWAFHLVTLACLDLEDAKHQLILLGQSWYMHPNGQLPAYEWNFSDVNPPVQAWAALRLYDAERRRNGKGDRKFLERVFTKLLLNFTWWVNRKDPRGLNVFEGGFLGMDNIGVFDRSAPLPVDGVLVQSDGTSWMSMYSLNMLRIAIELAQDDDAYQDIATKFFEHFLMIGGAMTNLGGEGLSLWDDADNFFYDWLVMSNGEATPLRVRSLVGLIPALSVETIDAALLKNMPSFTRQRDWYLRYRPKLAVLVSRWNTPGADDTRLLAIARAFRSSKVLARVLDKNEFLSDYGMRSLSRYHLDHPYVFETGNFRSSEVKYVPAESDSDLFGGNSNWRGPIWMPINYLFIESLNKFAKFYGHDFRVECPTGSAEMLSLKEIADELRNRLINIFRRDGKGRRPVFGTYEKMQTDPHFKDYLLFHEYYDGDTGRGLGASHQTGWSALVANMIAELHERAGPSASSTARLPRYPALFEINTRVWLGRLSREAAKPITLTDIDDATLDDLARRGFDWIWLLSVWRTGAASRALSRSNPAGRAEFQAALPDLTDEDICGSGFAIGAYEVGEALGGKAALAEFRARLAARGLRLMLDFVANHTALDHPWVKAHADFYVQGSEQALAAAPQNYRRVETDQGARILAHGRDPNLPGWPDTLQLDYANPALQAAQLAELVEIAGQCDGLRCDMAMLLLPEVFRRTWGLAAAPFWPTAIAAVRQAHPGFTFLAEAYWDLEWELQQQGFEYCYDKCLYDRLCNLDAGAIRAHLGAGLDYQDRLARFLENHDEPRAAAHFPWPRHQAAAIVTYFAPGLRFFHQGQLEGARVRVPVHLCRGPLERPNPDVAAFYDRLLAALAKPDGFRDGAWSLIPPQPAWAGNPTWQDFISYAWRTADGASYVVVVNYSDHQGQCRLRLPFTGLAGIRFRLADEMGSEVYWRDGSDLIDPGLYIDLGAWRYNVFRLEPVSAI